MNSRTLASDIMCFVIGGLLTLPWMSRENYIAESSSSEVIDKSGISLIKGNERNQRIAQKVVEPALLPAVREWSISQPGDQRFIDVPRRFAELFNESAVNEDLEMTDDMALFLAVTKRERSEVNAAFEITADEVKSAEIGKYKLIAPENCDVAAHMPAIDQKIGEGIRLKFESKLRSSLGDERAEFLLSKTQSTIIEQFAGFGKHSYDILVSRLDIEPGSSVQQMYQVNLFPRNTRSLIGENENNLPQLEIVVSKIPDRFEHITELWVESGTQ